MFLHLSVILLTGGIVSEYVLGKEYVTGGFVCDLGVGRHVT